MTNTGGSAIVFFDGYCGLCNETVDFLMSRDRDQVLRFAPLQGETAKRYSTEVELEDLDSVVVVRLENPETPIKLKKSTAVLFAISKLSTTWRILAGVAMLVPGSMRDLVYKLIAKNRFRLRGRRETCRLPTPEERHRLLP
jgi:predicted DCC family thiol-disulfide oxidoreductase YuxK